MCEDFIPNFGNKRIGCCITTFPFSPGTLFLSISPLKIKLKGRHFDTSEVMEAGLQAVLNILPE
jgi:hypothetical protein